MLREDEKARNANQPTKKNNKMKNNFSIYRTPKNEEGVRVTIADFLEALGELVELKIVLSDTEIYVSCDDDGLYDDLSKFAELEG